MRQRHRFASLPTCRVTEDRIADLPPTAEDAWSGAWTKIVWTLQRRRDPIKYLRGNAPPAPCLKNVTCAGPSRGMAIGQLPQDEIGICSLGSLWQPLQYGGPCAIC